MILNGLVTLLFFVIRLLCRASYCFGILSKGGAKFYFGCVVPGCFYILAFLLGPGASSVDRGTSPGWRLEGCGGLRGLFVRSRGKPGRSRNKSGMTVCELCSFCTSSRNRAAYIRDLRKHPAGVVFRSRPFWKDPGTSPGWRGCGWLRGLFV